MGIRNEESAKRALTGDGEWQQERQPPKCAITMCVLATSHDHMLVIGTAHTRGASS